MYGPVTLLTVALAGVASAMPPVWKSGYSYSSGATGTGSTSSTSLHSTTSGSGHGSGSLPHPTTSSSPGTVTSSSQTGSSPQGTGLPPSVTTKSHHHDTTLTWATGTATETVTLTVPITSVVTSFVPCSSSVAQSSGTTFYSTWLTATSYSTVHTTTTCQTLYPSPISHPAEVTTKTLTSSSAAPVVTPPSSSSTGATTLPPTTVWGPETDTCPPAKTVYNTIVSYTTMYETPAPSATGCKSCKVETVTVTLGGGSTTTVIVTHKPTETVTKLPWTPGQSHTSSSSQTRKPTGTGAIYPTGGHIKPTGW